MKKKVVLFDIDYTLFDVSHFDKNFYKELSKNLGLDEKSVRKLSVEIITSLITKESFLDIDKYVNILLKNLNKIAFKKKVENLLFNKLFFKSGFYKEVEESLTSIGKIARIGIFSQGDTKLQWAKIEQSGFKHLFDKDIVYIIKPRKLEFLSLLKEKHLEDKVYLVDDKPRVIDEVKKFMPAIFTIWVKRGKFVEQSKDIEDFKPDAIIDDLSKVYSIIERN